jgi:uncharacterized protein
MPKQIAFLCVVMFVLSTSAFAQSFNCRYAKKADEILICQDPQLSQLDERLASIYSQVHQNLYGSKGLQ